MDAAPAVPYEPAPSTGFVESKLFPGMPPNFKSGAPAETKDGKGMIRNVSIPALRRFPVDKSKLNGISLLVFPGGGYTLLDMDTHATAIANRLGPLGYQVFGVKYRVGGGANNAAADALLDAKRAVRVVRENAAKWGLDLKKVGVVGYSAGSHLIFNLAAKFDEGQAEATDPVERRSSRPDFIAGMCTPNFGGKPPFEIKGTSPPALICHAEDDPVPVATSRAIAKEYETVGVSVQLEIYAKGGHDAFNIAIPNNTGRNWPEEKLFPFLKMLKVLP